MTDSRKRLAATGATLLVGFFLFFASAATAETLRMGILPVLDTLPLQVAVNEGLFEERGLEVELVTFSSALERDTAMQAGRLDGYFGDLLNTFLLIKAGVPMKLATISYATVEGQRMFALLRAPGLEALDDIPSVGLSKATVIEYLLDAMSGLDAVKDVNFERIEIKKIPIRLQMLLEGQLDSAVLPEPLVALAESKGASVLVTDETLDMPLTVLSLHEKFAGQAAGFLAAYDEAVTRLNAEPEKYRDLMAKTCRIPKPLAASFPVYTYPTSALPTQADVAPVMDWMIKKGMLDEPLAYDSVIIH